MLICGRYIFSNSADTLAPSDVLLLDKGQRPGFIPTWGEALGNEASHRKGLKARLITCCLVVNEFDQHVYILGATRATFSAPRYVARSRRKDHKASHSCKFVFIRGCYFLADSPATLTPIQVLHGVPICSSTRATLAQRILARTENLL